LTKTVPNFLKMALLLFTSRICPGSSSPMALTVLTPGSGHIRPLTFRVTSGSVLAG
jgi:hypothetical protein